MSTALRTSSLLLSLSLLAGCASNLHTTAPLTAEGVPDYTRTEPLGAALEGWRYPYPVQYLQFPMDGHLVRMAYLDVAPTGTPNGQSVLLFHGKNFSADYWEHTIRALSARGYRVVAPDQIGFGKSSKPELTYTFAKLVQNNVRLLDHLKIHKTAIVANSMGGMLGVHFAHTHAARVSALVLENSLGLEEYVPAIPPQETAKLTQLEMAQTTGSYRTFIKNYFQKNYRPDFERFVEQFARLQASPEYPRVAHVSALTYQMIYQGSTYPLLPQLKVPTLLAIGQLDRTVFGRRFAPPEAVKALGHFPTLGKQAQARIPGSKLVEFDNVGHVPHLEAPERFHPAILEFLAAK